MLRIDEEEGPGAILVFLAGWDDISTLHQSLGQMPQARVYLCCAYVCGRGESKACVWSPPFLSHTRFRASLLVSSACLQASRWRLYPLHSQLPMDQQREIFQPPPQGLRKVGDCRLCMHSMNGVYA